LFKYIQGCINKQHLSHMEEIKIQKNEVLAVQ